MHRADPLPINAGKNGRPGNGKSCDKAVVCNCNYNVNAHSHVSEDIKELKDEDGTAYYTDEQNITIDSAANYTYQASNRACQNSVFETSHCLVN